MRWYWWVVIAAVGFWVFFPAQARRLVRRSLAARPGFAKWSNQSRDSADNRGAILDAPSDAFGGTADGGCGCK